MKGLGGQDMNPLINPHTTKSETTWYYHELSRTKIYPTLV